MKKLKIKGLKKACGETKDLNYLRGEHIQLAIDITTGELITRYHIGDNWTVFHDPDVRTIRHIYQACTMAEIREMVNEYLEELEQAKTWNEIVDKKLIEYLQKMEEKEKDNDHVTGGNH